jgi:adenylate kinase
MKNCAHSAGTAGNADVRKEPVDASTPANRTEKSGKPAAFPTEVLSPEDQKSFGTKTDLKHGSNFENVPGTSSSSLPEAIVLLGPSGSGKTPLGIILEKKGVAGRGVIHFDFGACLRSAVAQPEAWPGLSGADSAVIRRSLETGALLEAGEFPLVLKILKMAASKRKAVDGICIALNGIPRHLEQAVFLESYLRVIEVVFLECSTDVLAARIRENTGGDRMGRPDDAEEAVSRRWKVFEERTRRLLDHYASKGIRIVRIPVSTEDTGETLYAAFLRLREELFTSR